MNGSNIAVIPARSGSKGLKDKNIRILNGKPLLAYAIDAAFKTNLFDIVHVSTDISEYANIAREYGADVPFLRADVFSTDDASTWDAMKYVLEEYEMRGKIFDTITVLQPTSPLRTSDDILAAFDFFKEKRANMISSVCEMDHSPLWCNTLPEDLSMANFEDEKIAYMPRQKFPVYYRENGAIYILKTEHLWKNPNIYKDKCYGYIMPKSHSIDIDDEFDFLLVEAITNYKNN